ncbi:MAG: hypothetical protein ACTS79_02580 [Arsenophonus sp. ET-KM2-MAG3]
MDYTCTFIRLLCHALNTYPYSFRHLPDEFVGDHLLNPKLNSYQSIHTILYKDKIIKLLKYTEIHIQKMHKILN